ncbi:hypothetical protein [Guptibacillus algicola]|uniref:hypothetical protein n=1 Tax=Guptibacillus algicola TaxID=225844 RepID=UPI001CD2FAA1|nr:hypothetical protein [Alkalihalobacillus algicola]MCA0988489.1 hypothetical protein [Alkalihalobacillus algicola]
MRRLMLMIGLFFVFLIGCTSNEEVVTIPDGAPEYVQEEDINEIEWENKAEPFGDGNMVGNEGKSGVIGMDQPSLEGQKWMWHLWGVEEAELTVVGYHRESGTVHQILNEAWTIPVMGENNGADSHAPSSVKVPKKGEWAMLLYTDDTLFDTLVYEIDE